MTSLKTEARKVINVGIGPYHSCVNYYNFTAPALKLAPSKSEMWVSHFAKIYTGNSATEK